MAITKYVSDFTINLFPISLTGSLVGVKRAGMAKETGLTSICPSCEEITKVNQQYACPNGHGPFKVGDLVKAREVSKGTFVRVSAEDVAAARVSELPVNVLDLTIHDARDVDAQTFPSDSAYIFYPKVLNQQYGVIADLLADPNKAFIGICNLRNNERLVRLSRWGSNIVLQTLWYPEELNPRDMQNIDYDKKFLDMTQEFLGDQVAAFEPSEYTNKQRERLQQVAGDGPTQTVTTRAPRDSDAAALEALTELLKKKSG